MGTRVDGAAVLTRRDRRAVIAARAALAALLTFVAYLSVAPPGDTPESGFALAEALSLLLFGDAAFADKIGHFSAYAALGAVAVPARLWRARAVFAPLALGFYGIVLEGFQMGLPARDADFFDGLANVAGAVVGFYGSSVALTVWRRRTLRR
ncbi:MAG: VanZ family protein [Pseudomonadota bacterium]